jgi:hypothetical protein
MLGRLNLFWAGAGGFLSLFCLNEIVAYHLSRTPKWLGGPLVYGGMVVGLIFGLSVVAFLGIEQDVQGGDLTPPAPSPSRAEGEEKGEGEDEGGETRMAG